MKKLAFLVMALAFFTGIGFAEGNGEVNVRAGLDVVGKSTLDIEGNELGLGNKIGFTLSAEYMYSVHNIVKVGAGLQYLTPREVDFPVNGGGIEIKPSFLPVYASLQVNPFNEASGLFLKGNIGYNVIFSAGDDVPSGVDEKGGVYFGAGVGYETEMGILFDAMYGYYGGKFEADDEDDIKVHLSQVTVSIGYKFKL